MVNFESSTVLKYIPLNLHITIRLLSLEISEILKAIYVSFPEISNVPEVLNVHMNEIYKKLTTIK